MMTIENYSIQWPLLRDQNSFLKSSPAFQSRQSILILKSSFPSVNPQKREKRSPSSSEFPKSPEGLPRFWMDVIHTCSILCGGRVDVGLAPVTVALRWMPSRVFGKMSRTLAGDPAPAMAPDPDPPDPDGSLVSGRKLSSSVSLSLSISDGSSLAATSVILPESQRHVFNQRVTVKYQRV